MAKKNSIQSYLERNIFALYLGLAISVSIAGIVEIVPLFTSNDVTEDKMLNTDGSKKFPEVLWQRKNSEKLADWKAGDGIRPYTALELAGRDIYQREGCYLCHSQMIRPFRDENERYGHFSLAVESKYDHPFQWGSKRTGPDLARVGGKYSNQWHLLHLNHPQSLVPESVMPKYKFLNNAKVDGKIIQEHMKAMTKLGVPYTDGDINEAVELVNGKTEMDAIISYLQVLGTMIKFKDGIEYRK